MILSDLPKVFTQTNGTFFMYKYPGLHLSTCHAWLIYNVSFYLGSKFGTQFKYLVQNFLDFKWHYYILYTSFYNQVHFISKLSTQKLNFEPNYGFEHGRTNTWPLFSFILQFSIFIQLYLSNPCPDHSNPHFNFISLLSYMAYITPFMLSETSLFN